MAKRKTSSDYRKEHADAVNKVEALHARIEKRCLDMCNKFPDVIVEGTITAGKFAEMISLLRDNATETYLIVMSKIEEDNERKANIKQTKIDF